MTSSPELPEPIRDLRAAMDRVRQTQETSSWVINIARNEVESTPINREFLTAFQNILPFSAVYEGKHDYQTKVVGFSIKDPINVRPTTTFGATYDGYAYQDEGAVIVIGEKDISATRPGLKEILTVGWNGKFNRKTNKRTTSPCLTTRIVPLKPWNTVREARVNTLHKSYSEDDLMKTFNKDSETFIIGAKTVIPIIKLVEPYLYSRNNDGHIKRRLGRVTKVGKEVIGYAEAKERTLQNSDFEEFDVMRYMEFIVAAYGVGDQFDAIKAAREAKLPQHPAQTILGLNDYRKMSEQASLYDLPVSEK
jgi:hypothetical protein